MHSVARTTQPTSLKNNADEWTKNLLEQLNIFKEVNKIPETYTNKYRQTDVQKELRKMYNKRCCYCESKIGAQTHEHIEHLEPKSKFPHKCFEWTNLHWVCPICNSSNKGNKWNRDNPILDPTKDTIEDYIDIDLSTGDIVPIDENKRAKTTIEDTGLNRIKLREERQDVIRQLNELIIIAKKNDSMHVLIQSLKIIAENSAYCSIYNKYISLLSEGI